MNRKFVVLLLIALQFSSAFANWGLLSVFDPGNGKDQDRVTAMENWQGKHNALQLVFTSFDASEQSVLWPQLVDIWNTGHVPIIAWEPWYTQAAYPNNIASLIAAGQYDTYLQSWGGNLFTFIAGPDGKMNTADDRRAYMRFAHEFNGNWYPWSASATSTPQDYINMYLHVQSLITSLGVDRKHLQWIWSSICCEPAGVPPMESYFVGNDAIDWIGIGGFNFGTSVSWSAWYTAENQFADMVGRMRKLTGGKKPLGITEVCTVSNGGNKNEWLTGLFSYAETNNIRMISYFNLDKNEVGGNKDWAIFGGAGGDQSYTYKNVPYNAYSGYKQGLSTNYWVGSDSTLSSFVTDNMYYGIGTCADSTDCLTGFACNAGVCVDSGAAPATSPAAASASPQVQEPSATPSTSVIPPSAAPSQSQAAQASASSSQAPASATPSRSPVVASPSSQVKGSVAVGSASIPVPSNSSVSNGTVLNIFKSGVASFSEVKTFGGTGTNVMFNVTRNATEGTTMISAKTVSWGGFGLYNYSSPSNISNCTQLSFNLATSAPVTIEIQDTLGFSFPVTILKNNMVWQKYSILLQQFSGVNLESINGEFIITMHTTGRFLVDTIYFQ